VLYAVLLAVVGQEIMPDRDREELAQLAKEENLDHHP
jgi:hypothetical protein